MYKEINNFLNLFRRYIEDVSFNIRAIAPKTTGISEIHDYLTSEELQGWKHLNQQGKEIYFRPRLNCFVLVDLDNKTSNQINELLDDINYNPICIVKTSKECYQAWFYCPQSKTKEDYIAISRHLTTNLGGDMGSAKSEQVGRLPKFINNKRNKQKVLLLWFNEFKSVQTLHIKELAEAKKKYKAGNIKIPASKNPKTKTAEISQGFDYFIWGVGNQIVEERPNITNDELAKILKSMSKESSMKFIEQTVHNIRFHQQGKKK